LVHGIPIGNISGMKAAGIQPENVAKILNRSFMKQIFVHGHVYLCKSRGCRVEEGGGERRKRSAEGKTNPSQI
jgi:hypothetical protein